LYSSVVNAVANAAAIVAQQLVVERFRTRQMRRTTRGSVPGRHFRKRLRRSVRQVYEELGEVYFRRAYRMKLGTFQRLASILRPYIIATSGKKQETQVKELPPEWTNLVRSSTCLCPALVRWGVVVRHHDYIRYRSHRRDQQVSVCG
jgi:hypothetical protein